jgi:LacI family transcriptional regulator
VQDATARLVLDAMNRLDYHPNELARGLKARRSGVIGVIAPSLAHEFVAVSVEAVHRSVHLAGKTVMLMFSGGDPETERRQVQLMLRRQVEGLIIFPFGSSLAKKLAREIGETPAVTIDNPSASTSISSVMVPNRKASREAVEHLLQHGYKRVAIVGVKPDWKTISDRILGAREAIAGTSASCVECVCATEEELTTDLLAQLFKNVKTAPRAVFTLSSYASEQVLHAAVRLGLRIPEDIALVGFDDFRMANLLGLTVVRQPIEEMCATAVRLLLDREVGRPTRKRVVLNTELIVRRSSGVLLAR